MSSMPSHMNATNTQAGNARENFTMRHMNPEDMAAHAKAMQYGNMKGDYAPGMAGGRVMEAQCHFPAPPPQRCYCSPAAFSRNCGSDKYHRLLSAYGASVPCHGNY